MKNLKLLLIFLLIISCTATTEVVTELSTTTTLSSTTTSSTTTTIPEDPLIVKTFEELPNALVRIQVKSTQAELTEDLEIEIFEYEGSGSGFFISSDGYIVTNNHVISGAVTIEVFTQYRSQPYTAKLIGLSECDDLAVIKIDIDDAQYLVFENSEPKLGQDILAAGFPLGDEEVTFLNGIVSKKQTNGSTSWASIEYAFEHTAEILPGSSGGPIVNEEVKVLGIAYAGNEDRQEFGIPIVVVENKIQQIINDEFQYTFKANVEQFYGGGLYVYSVDSDSPLREVGLKGGELITEIKGLSLADETTLKVYCDALFARDPDIGINFAGVSLEDLEEFEVEVSLDGSVSIISERVSITTTTSTTTTTTTTLPPKPFYEQNVLDAYKDSFGNNLNINRWNQERVTISILGNPSSTQERLIRDTALLFDTLIESIDIEVVDYTNADINFYFGAQSTWRYSLNDCNLSSQVLEYTTNYNVGIETNEGQMVKVSSCMLPEELMNNWSKYQISRTGISGCAIYQIRRAFWMSFVGWNEGLADMNKYGWGYCTNYQTHNEPNTAGPYEVTFEDRDRGGPISPCGWCGNCNTPQFSEIDKKIISLHNHEYVSNAKTINEVVALLSP